MLVLLVLCLQTVNAFVPNKISSFTPLRASILTNKHTLTMNHIEVFTFERSNLPQLKNNKSFTHKIGSYLTKYTKILLPLSLQILVFLFLGVTPSFAAIGKRKSSAVAAVSVASKPPPLWKKIIEGANVTGNFKKWKPGDTRAEFSTIVNVATSLIILGGLLFIATLHHLNVQRIEEKNLKREVIRVKEYKEVFFYCDSSI